MGTTKPDMLISPSVHALSFCNLQEGVSRITNANYLHVDVMDGIYVPNISFGTNMMHALHSISSLPLDVHLMIEDPEKSMGSYLELQPAFITFHPENVRHVHRLVSLIHEAGVGAGIALNPATPPELLLDILYDLDLVLVMSVNPGFSGQRFIEHTYDKLKRLQELLRVTGANPLVEVDGGVDINNVGALAHNGVGMVVSGSAIFNSDDPYDYIEQLKSQAALGMIRDS